MKFGLRWPSLMLDSCPLSKPRKAKPSRDKSVAINCNRFSLLDGLIAVNCTEELTGEVLSYLASNLSDNTRRAYAADLKHFEEWGGVFPASEPMVANYLAAFGGKLSCSTLERRLATLSKVHRMHGFTNPIRSDLVRATMRGIKRKHGVAQRQAKPLLAEQLAEIVDGLGDSPRDIRDKALLLLGFAGAFRRSELVGIDIEDLEWHEEGIIVSLCSSKTDQMQKGRLVPILAAQNTYCPVQAVRTWLSIGSIVRGAIFRSINRHGSIGEVQLEPGAVSRIVKLRAQQVGLNQSEYSGHSLRAGYVTSAVAAGASTLRIRQQTGHTTEQALSAYVRPNSFTMGYGDKAMGGAE